MPAELPGKAVELSPVERLVESMPTQISADQSTSLNHFQRRANSTTRPPCILILDHHL